jgi:nucleotide-binding universal stress UspA family protein
MAHRIVVAIDGSESASRAVQWCAEHAGALGAEVVAVHALQVPLYAGSSFAYLPLPPLTEEQRDEIVDLARRDWCGSLDERGVAFRVVLAEGAPADVVLRVADAEDAELIVTGRRGRGGFSELLLGSVSHALAHHARRPLLIVP